MYFRHTLITCTYPSQTTKLSQRIQQSKRLGSGDSYLGLAGNGCRLADFLPPQSVDDGALADVRVADEADADLLLVQVQLPTPIKTMATTGS